MVKIICVILSQLIFFACSTTPSKEILSEEEVKYEKDKSYCEAYTEYPVTTHPNYIRCMKERGWKNEI
jgi:hypothetical protein